MACGHRQVKTRKCKLRTASEGTREVDSCDWSFASQPYLYPTNAPAARSGASFILESSGLSSSHEQTTTRSSFRLDTTCHLLSTFISHRKIRSHPAVKPSRTANVFTHQRLLRAGSEEQGTHPPMHSFPDFILTSFSRDPAIGTETRTEPPSATPPTSPRHPNLQSPRPLKRNRS